jgi:hypothetical protein
MPAGYSHHWENGAHIAKNGGSARFDLEVADAGTYDVAVWWPADLSARAGWASAMSVTIASSEAESIAGIYAAAVTVDLRTQGGDGWFTVANATHLEAGAIA